MIVGEMKMRKERNVQQQEMRWQWHIVIDNIMVLSE